MTKLQTMLKNPHIRFKTIGELIEDYGTNWMDNVSAMISSADAISTMAYFQGKVLYPSLMHLTSWKTHFYYGPTSSHVCITMLTTKQIPKYDACGNILKPGMIVRIDYMPVDIVKNIVSNNLRNTPGTLVKVLKVFTPSGYVESNRLTNQLERVNKLFIVTELRSPLSGISTFDAERMYSSIFKNGQVCAFEIMHRVCKATDVEKKFYYKSLQNGNEPKTYF